MIIKSCRFDIHLLRCAILTLLALVLVPTKNASAQESGVDDRPFQIGVVTDDLWRNDTEIDLTNSGATGPICVSVYGMNAQAQLSACCTCLVQPNALAEISINRDLLGTVSQKSKPHTLVVKLLGTSNGVVPLAPKPTSCAAASINSSLVQGMLAWHKTLPVEFLPIPASAQVQFAPATLSERELTNLTNSCPTASACNSSCGGAAVGTRRLK